MKALITFIAVAFVGLAAQAQDIRTETYDNGQIKTEYTIFGEYIQMVSYYEDGAIKETGSYLNNLPHGEYKKFDRNGDLLTGGQYVRGQKQGSWTFRANNGEMLYHVEYVDNIQVNVDRWVAAE